MALLSDYTGCSGSSGKNDDDDDDDNNNNNNDNKINNNPYHHQQQQAASFPLQAPSTPPPHPPPYSPSSPPSGRDTTSDTCFSCKRVGHWSRDCPSKTLKLIRSSTPSSSNMESESSHLPVIRCPCGAGACRVFTSNTQKNPNRKFYTCPSPKRSVVECKFFKWCDEVLQCAIPPCKCGAGISSINRDYSSSGPHAFYWFFACRMKKNHGACKFYQRVDPKLDFLLNNYCRVERYPSHSPPTEQHTLNVASDKKQQLISDIFSRKQPISDITIGSPGMQVSENLSNSIIPQTSADNDEVPSQDVVVKETDSWVPVIGEGRRVCGLLSQSDIQLLQRKFWRQISAAGDSLAGERACQFFGVQFQGWMGVCPSSYPILTQENANVSDVEILVPPLGNESEVAMHVPVEHPPEQNDEPLSNTLCDPASTETSSSVEREDSFSSLILKSLGPGLLKILESMQGSDHKKMLKVAESTFESFRAMQVDCGAFCEAVKEYINCQSRLASMEDASCKDMSAEQLIDEYYIKKAHFDHVSQLHSEAVAAFEASNARVRPLCEEALVLREKLTQLEKQISDCESETLKLRNGVDEIYAKKIEAETHMEAASLAMEEALELEKQIDLENATAKATMKKLQGLMKE